MTILLDTNIILDILQKREPFFQNSYMSLKKAIGRDMTCLISATAATDIFYVLRKALQSSQQARLYIEQISQLVTFADVQGTDINKALMSQMLDFEDAVVDAVAERNDAMYIITRNVKDYEGSVVQAISPEEFLKNNI